MLEAVLLVGGLGTRLRPLTLTTPKPMLPVGGIPFIAHQIGKLQEARVEHVVLATAYKPEVFLDYFGNGSKLGLQITCVRESEPLGTGGAIRNAAAALLSRDENPVVVLNGDALSGHDLAGQIAQHERTAADVTLHLVEVDDARAYGCVPTDGDGRVTAFLEKMPEPVTHWINAGGYVFRRSVIDTIPADQVISVERDTFPGLLAIGANVRAWQQSAYWIDVGTPEALVKCSADVVRGIAKSSAYSGGVADFRILGGAVVADDANVHRGSTVGRGASVGPAAGIDGSILMDGAVVGPGAQLHNSVLGHDASVGAGCVLVNCVIGDEAVVPDGITLEPGTRLEPGSH